MTSYITITDEETDPGGPGTSEWAKKCRDNPIAIAEGATGAPRILGAALIPEENVLAEFTPLVVSAADTNQWENGAGFRDVSVLSSSNSTSFVLAQSMTNYGYTGTARVRCKYRSSGPDDVYIDLRINGVSVYSDSTGITTDRDRSYDATIAPGDLIEWYIRSQIGGTTCIFTQVGIRSDKSLYRLGALATRG